MKRVTGIGGIFFKTDNAEESREWYRKHLGIASGQYGGTFKWRHGEDGTSLATQHGALLGAIQPIMNPVKRIS